MQNTDTTIAAIILATPKPAELVDAEREMVAVRQLQDAASQEMAGIERSLDRGRMGRVPVLTADREAMEARRAVLGREVAALSQRALEANRVILSERVVYLASLRTALRARRLDSATAIVDAIDTIEQHFGALTEIDAALGQTAQIMPPGEYLAHLRLVAENITVECAPAPVAAAA